jgi:hypothetical protein
MRLKNDRCLCSPSFSINVGLNIVGLSGLIASAGGSFTAARIDINVPSKAAITQHNTAKIMTSMEK